MKLAYLVNTYPAPSHSFIRREIRALERQGHEVVRFAMRSMEAQLVDPADKAENALTEHVLSQGRGKLLTALARRFGSSPRALLDALRMAVSAGRASRAGVLRHFIYLVEACYVAERCRALGIEHLHAHFGTNSATVAMLARAVGGVTYSFTVHGPEEFDHPVDLGLDLKMHHAAFTVAVSSFGRSQLCRWADHADWKSIRVVHCGIEPETFPEPVPLPEGNLRLVSIGRLVEQKGQLLLVDALAQAARVRSDFHLTLVGDGEMRPQIEAAIIEAGLQRHVTITGWVDEARVRAELEAAHALVMPSFAEGLPMVIMEAMAAGRPVIATFIAGIPELVTPETGRLVPAGDADALAAAILDMAALPQEFLAKMGQKARERVMARHNVNQEANILAVHFLATSNKQQRISKP